jgi:hypothetical protein
MTATIEWLTSMDDALGRAKKEVKPILLDFFNPG